LHESLGYEQAEATSHCPHGELALKNFDTLEAVAAQHHCDCCWVCIKNASAFEAPPPAGTKGGNGNG
jgi:hypothetical protein